MVNFHYVAKQGLSVYCLQKELHVTIAEKACRKVVPYSGDDCPTQAATLANCRLSLPTGWFVMHSFYWRHLIEIADGSRHTIVSPCIGILTLQLPILMSLPTQLSALIV